MQDIQDPDHCVRSEKPADADGTGAICRRETCRRWWNRCGLRAQDLQVLLVRRQRGQYVCVETWPSIVRQQSES